MHNLLTNSTDLLRVTAGSAADLDCIVSFIEYTNATPPVLDAMDTQFTNINTATTATILGAPTSSSDRRRIKSISIVNTHASVSTTCRVYIERTGPINWDVFNTVTLAPGESLTYTEGLGWFYNKTAPTDLPSGAATTAQIASHSADTYYLGMATTYNGATRLKAGSFFRFTWRSNKGGGTATPTYIIRYGTAGTTADTARITMTGAAQTAVADEAYFVMEVGFRAVGASAVMVANHKMIHRLGTTGFSVTAANVLMTPVVSGTFDSGVANSILGLSVNPGASGAWVTDLVCLDAVNLVM
jgi:hypothetical protein